MMKRTAGFAILQVRLIRKNRRRQLMRWTDDADAVTRRKRF